LYGLPINLFPLHAGVDDSDNPVTVALKNYLSDSSSSTPCIQNGISGESVVGTVVGTW